MGGFYNVEREVSLISIDFCSGHVSVGGSSNAIARGFSSELFHQTSVTAAHVCTHS